MATLVGGFFVLEARLPMDYLRVIRQKVDAVIPDQPGWVALGGH